MAAAEASGRFLVDGGTAKRGTVVLAPGASGAMDTPRMNRISETIAAGGLRVMRFEFPYAVEQRATGVRRAPNTERILRQTWLDVIEELGPTGLVIRGKSMGGRFASMVADEAGGGVPGLPVPSAREARTAQDRSPRGDRHPRAHRAGRARHLRPPRGGRASATSSPIAYACTGSGTVSTR